MKLALQSLKFERSNLHNLWRGCAPILASTLVLSVAIMLPLHGCGGSTSNSGLGFSGGSATSAQVQRGRYLVTTMDCAGCHSGSINDPNSSTWLQGYSGPAAGSGPGAFQLGPFWVYAANLTPDTTGLKSFTDQQVFNALKHGLDPADTPSAVITGDTPGSGNFPATPIYLPPIMPWSSFRHIADEDVWAIVAYLKHGIKAVNNPVVASSGPPDNWASSVTDAAIGPKTLPAYPAGGEVFAP